MVITTFRVNFKLCESSTRQKLKWKHFNFILLTKNWRLTKSILPSGPISAYHAAVLSRCCAWDSNPAQTNPLSYGITPVSFSFTVSRVRYLTDLVFEISPSLVRHIKAKK